MNRSIGLLILGFVWVSGAASAQPNIAVTVDGTTYQCSGGGGGVNCEGAGDAFRQQLEYCYKNNSGTYCASTHWPKFKQTYPNCAYAGVSACLEYCYKNNSGSYCASVCSY